MAYIADKGHAVAEALKLVQAGLASGAISTGDGSKYNNSADAAKAAGQYIGGLVEALAEKIANL